MYSKIGGGGVAGLQRKVRSPLQQSSHNKVMLTSEPIPKVNSCIIPWQSMQFMGLSINITKKIIQKNWRVLDSRDIAYY